MKLIPASVTQAMGRQTLILQKHSPKILFGLGIVGVVSGTVMACKATLKLPQKLDEFKAEIDDAKEIRESDGNGYLHVPTDRDMVYIYSRHSYEIVKLYAPAILVGSLSIAALTTSHVTLTRRNASLTAAYSALQMSFEAYRDRVKEALGPEKEHEIRYAIKHEKVDVDGKIHEIKTADPNTWSEYARFFDEGSPNWTKNPEINRLFVQCQMNYANNLLQARGHVFLNEVYDMLGIDRSQAGQVVGWVLSEDHDNFIDFGLFDAANARFINGTERSILLDFNVDGIIFDKI